MNFLRSAGLSAVICLVALWTSCGRAENTVRTDTGTTAEQADAKNANADLALDSEMEETGQEERKPSTDLFIKDGDIYTQFLKLTVPGEWEGNVTFHYFQEPEEGRYELAVMENDRMTATEGTGGYVLSVVLTKNCPEKPPGEDYYYLGTLIKEEEDLFHVIMEYPESARSMEGNGEPGIRILDTGDEIAGLLKGRNGYTFETGEYPGNTEE